jgi:hypothetical protein
LSAATWYAAALRATPNAATIDRFNFLSDDPLTRFGPVPK